MAKDLGIPKDFMEYEFYLLDDQRIITGYQAHFLIEEFIQ